MLLLHLVLIAFLVLESINIVALYFRPGSRSSNALGVFAAWEASKQDPDVHDLVRYLAFWVAGTKLIFVMLLISILVFGDQRLKVTAVGVLIISIASFFWRLFPLIRRVDARDGLKPHGYSKTLGRMITAIIVVMTIALAFAIVEA
jgi:hypothetical protein